MAAAIKITAQVRMERLDSAIKQLTQAVGMSQREALDTAAEMVLQSAAKAMPKGKYTRRPMEHQSRNNQWRVGYKTLKRKGAKWFGKQSDARKFARITYRGVARAQFAIAARMLGYKTATRGMTRQAVEKAADETNTSRGSDLVRPWVQAVTGIESAKGYRPVAVNIGMRKATSRLRGWANKEMKKATSRVK